MDFVKNALGGKSGTNNQNQQTQQGGSSSGGGFADKLNEMAGGGRKGEANEDALDKGKIQFLADAFLGCLYGDSNLVIAIDYAQEKFLGQGDQSNESAVEQMKDDQIAGFIRNQYKNATGSEFPIKEKNKKSGM